MFNFNLNNVIFNCPVSVQLGEAAAAIEHDGRADGADDVPGEPSHCIPAFVRGLDDRHRVSRATARVDDEALLCESLHRDRDVRVRLLEAWRFLIKRSPGKPKRKNTQSVNPRWKIPGACARAWPVWQDPRGLWQDPREKDEELDFYKKRNLKIVLLEGCS